MSVAVENRTFRGDRVNRLNLDPVIFTNNFDRRGFLLQHNLAGHPLLELPAIAALSQRLPANLLEWNSEQEGAFTAPDQMAPHHLSCAETILNLEEQPARILLLQIEKDPPYRQLLDELLDQIEPLTRATHPGMWERHAFLFLSSKAAYTPFHFDPDYNFLLQVRGEKTVSMWDPADREVLPASAIDGYYAARDGMGAMQIAIKLTGMNSFVDPSGCRCAPAKAFTFRCMRRMRLRPRAMFRSRSA